MPAPGEYSDTLRALGRFLEMVGASEIGIIDEGDQLEVSWRGRGNTREERRYRAFELRALRTTARLFRGLEGGTPCFTRSELLRTLGYELDKMAAQGIRLIETSEGYYVSARVQGREFGRPYTLSELMAQAREQHRRRLTEQATGPARSPQARATLAQAAPGPRTPLLAYRRQSA